MAFPHSPRSGPTAVPNPLRRLTLDDLRRRTSIKWRAHPEDVLPLWVAEMDVPLAEPVVRALTEAVALGDTGYPVGEEYADALGDFTARRWGWRPGAGHTAIVPDVMLGVVEVLKLVTGPGDAVVVNPPVYPPFYPFVEHLGRRIVEAPLGEDHRLDPDALDSAFARATAGGRPAAYLLCSPHNPTGTVHTRAELERVAELAEAYGIRVVADEIHAPLVLPGAEHVPYLSVRGSANGFSLMSASKAWNLAGLKAALAVAGPEAAGDLARMPEEVSHGPSHLGVIAHSAALRHGGEWLDALLAGLDENRRLLAGLLARHLPGVRYRAPQGTYLAWLDCRALGLGDDPAAVFLERGRVALNPGPDFGTGGAGHVRLNLATSPEVLTEAVRRMAAAL
ncbi:MalY/PatB family protein [Streptomyces sp.]|uniref:MalY/PatB family protein n=1 Tax=Streptomyces sp. TaxID=1931 RepID=UPI0039C9F83F